MQRYKCRSRGSSLIYGSSRVAWRLCVSWVSFMWRTLFRPYSAVYCSSLRQLQANVASKFIENMKPVEPEWWKEHKVHGENKGNLKFGYVATNNEVLNDHDTNQPCSEPLRRVKLNFDVGRCMQWRVVNSELGITGLITTYSSWQPQVVLRSDWLIHDTVHKRTVYVAHSSSL